MRSLFKNGPTISKILLNINVQDISKRYFGGGGHFNAAGAKSDLSLDQTIKKVENIIKNEFS